MYNITRENEPKNDENGQKFPKSLFNNGHAYHAKT